jgi:hypothetical protein
MINNNILSDRLNNFKKGSSIKTEDPLLSNKLTLFVGALSYIWLGMWDIIQSCIYGHSINLIFNKGWKTIDEIIVGFMILLLFNTINNFIHNNKNIKN